MTDADRQFRVHARHLDRHHARLVTERSFEAAAIAYIEEAPFPADEAELKIVVHDIASGHEHCFRVDLHTGEAMESA